MATTVNVTCPKCGDDVECQVSLKIGGACRAEGGGLTVDVSVAEIISGPDEHIAAKH